MEKNQASSTYEPTESESYMSSKMCAYFKNILETWRNKIVGMSHEDLKVAQEENNRESDPLDAGVIEEN